MGIDYISISSPLGIIVACILAWYVASKAQNPFIYWVVFIPLALAICFALPLSIVTWGMIGIAVLSRFWIFFFATLKGGCRCEK